MDPSDLDSVVLKDGAMEGLVKLVNKLMLQNQKQELGTLDGACKARKHSHATKSKAQRQALP